MRISDWSSDVCSSDLWLAARVAYPIAAQSRRWCGFHPESAAAASWGTRMSKSIADFGLRVGQRYQEMRKAARQGEVESFFTDSRAVSHVCLRDILDPSLRVTLVDRQSAGSAERVSVRVDS